MQYGLKNAKCMIIITGREKQEQKEEEIKEGKIEEVDAYIKITLNNEGNLKEHIKEIESKASRPIREINGISSKYSVGEEERVKTNFFRHVSYNIVILYGFEAILHEFEA